MKKHILKSINFIIIYITFNSLNRGETIEYAAVGRVHDHFNTESGNKDVHAEINDKMEIKFLRRFNRDLRVIKRAIYSEFC